jgi:hypothetical protein
MSFMVQENGTLTEGARQTCARVISGFAGKHIHITIAEKKEKRSLDQNAYYRGVVLPHVRAVMMEAGHPESTDYWHEVLLESFAPMVQTVNIHGEVIGMRPKRTHNMTMEEMATFITAVSAEMASRGDPVPARDL